MVSSLGNTGIPEHAATAFRAGVAEAIPKSLTHRLRVSLKRLAKPVWLVCREGLIEFLLGELALHRLEMVLADRPMPAGLAVRAHSCKLGERSCLLCLPRLLRQDVAFPACPNGAPLLLPGQNAAIRGEIDRWLGETRLNPRVVGEFDDRP